MAFSALTSRNRGLWALLLTNAVVKSLLVMFLINHVSILPSDGTGFRLDDASLLIFVCMLLGVAHFIERYVSQSMAIRCAMAVRRQKFEHFISLPLKVAQRTDRDRLWMSITGDMSSVRNWVMYGLVPIFTYGAWLLVALFFLLFSDLWLGVSLIGLSLILVPLAWLWSRGMRTADAWSRRVKRKLMRQLRRTIYAAEIVHLSNERLRELKRFRDTSDLLEQAEIRKARSSALMRGLIEATAFMLLVAIAYIGLRRVFSGAMTSDQLTTILLMAAYMLPYVRKLLRAQEYWQRYQAVMGQSSQLFKKSSGSRKGYKLDIAPESSVPVSIRRCNRSVPLHADAGQIVAWPVSKQSDVLCSLLAAFQALAPLSSVRCEINGVDYNCLSRVERARRIAVIAPPYQSASHNIERHLRYGARRLTDRKLQDVIDRFDLKSVIRQFDDSAREKLSAWMPALSAYELLRLELARAYLRQVSFVIVADQSWLEMSSYRSAIQQMLESWGATIVLVIPEHQGIPTWVTKVWKSSGNVSSEHSFQVEVAT